MSLARFTDPAVLRGESFSHGLTRLGPDENDEPSSLLDLYVDEEGNASLSGRLLVYEGTDPLDCDKIPTFSPSNNLVAGLASALPPPVPDGAYFPYQANGDSAPPGYAYCDGSVYSLPNGDLWTTPDLPTPHIQKLPAGAELARS